MAERIGYIGLGIRPKYKQEHIQLINALSQIDLLKPARAHPHITTHFASGIRDEEVHCLREGLREGLSVLRNDDFKVGGLGVSTSRPIGLLYLKVDPPESFNRFNTIISQALPVDQDRLSAQELLHVSAASFNKEKQILIMKLYGQILNRLFSKIAWEFRVNQAAICLGKNNNYVKC